MAACLAGSFLVAGVTSLVPPPPPVLAAAEDEVAFDAEELRSQLPAYVASGTLYGRWAGEPVVVRPKPVAGLDQARTDNAFVIIEVGQELKLPRRAYVVAIATALQESNLRNLANTSVSASLRLPHEGAARDFDSVGLFQQRPSQGWGSVPQLMDPAQSAAKFYNKLRRISGWEDLSVARAAQAVQRSAFPDAYAKHTAKAEAIVDGILTQLPST